MATAQLSDIYRFQAVTANLGTAGQPTAAQFDAVKDAGYEVVINLALGTPPRDLPNEPGIVAAHGIDYAHIPVVFDAPTDNTGIIGLLELNGFFACTAGTPYCIGAAHIACPRSKPVLDVRVQPYATWQHGHHGIVCIEASATIGAHALPLMIISTSF